MTSQRTRPMDLLMQSGSIQFVNGLFAKYFYPNLTRRFRDGDVVFFNWAYEEDPPMAVPLTAADEPNRYFIQLYHRTGAQADIRGKEVLEVSCGHGGGASYLVRTFEPAAYTGLDLNREGIKFCQEHHKVAALKFMHGNAGSLPFDDQSFDAVVNVEASSHYPSFARFLTEVARVLRPGGHFLYTDHRRRPLYEKWDAELADAPLRLVTHSVINAEVMRGMEKNEPRWEQIVNKLPRFLRRYGREAAGVPGSAYYRGLKDGSLSYRVYQFVKD